MRICTSRVMLRDFTADDRAAFMAYQMDSRYRRLYNLNADPARANDLFDLFARWRDEEPRRNLQLGIFDRATGLLCGSAGLREQHDDLETAMFGIELAPSEWGRYRIALEVAACMMHFGFDTLKLRAIVGETASGNMRVVKLARWFGAHVIDQCDGPEWMRARGWRMVRWSLHRDAWRTSKQELEALRRLRIDDSDPR